MFRHDFINCPICNRENHITSADGKVIDCCNCGAPIFNEKRPASQDDIKEYQKRLRVWGYEHQNITAKQLKAHSARNKARKQVQEQEASAKQEFTKLKADLELWKDKHKTLQDEKDAQEADQSRRIEELQNKILNQEQKCTLLEHESNKLNESVRAFTLQNTRLREMLVESKNDYSLLEKDYKKQQENLVTSASPSTLLDADEDNTNLDNFNKIDTVALSQKSQEDIWLGLDTLPTFLSVSQGDYWVITQDNRKFYLVVQENVILNASNLKTLKIIYSYIEQPDISTLEKTYKRLARVECQPDSKWILVERGEILFH